MRQSAMVWCCLLVCAPAIAQDACLEGRLADTAEEFYTSFSRSVDVSGDFAVVGDSRGWVGEIMWAGSVFVYRGGKGAWEQEQRLVASDASLMDAFGVSVAVSSEFIIAGAPGAESGESFTGAVYSFRWDGSSWQQHQKLTAIVEQYGAHFGSHIALAGDTLVVLEGADWSSPVDSAAQFFRFDGEEWKFEQRITTEVEEYEHDEARFVSVALDGDTALLGAEFGNKDEVMSYAVHVLRFDGASWEEETRIDPPAKSPAEFGETVALDGDFALVGAPGDRSESEYGAVYAYRREGNDWSDAEPWIASDGSAGDSFGASLALRGGIALIGAPRAASPKTASGFVYVFRDEKGSWSEIEKIGAEEGIPGDRFGHALGISDDAARGIVGVSWSLCPQIDRCAYVVALDGCDEALDPRTPVGARFRRGDFDGQNGSGISDGLALLRYGFLGGTAPPCLDAADADDDGRLSPIQDTLLILFHLFAAGLGPPCPGSVSCGIDPTDDDLECETEPEVCAG